MKDGTNDNNILADVPQKKVKNNFIRPAVLVCEKNHGNSSVYNLPNNKDFFVGKNPDNDLCLEGDNISHVHAKISPEQDSYVIYDLASESGLTVNWAKKSKCRLEHKDRIKIGSYSLIFEFIKEGRVFRERKMGNRTGMVVKFLVNSENGIKEVSGMVKDISLNSAWIESERELQKGKIIEVGISSAQLPIIEAIAQVIWERARDKDGKILYNIGLQFLEMDEKSKNRLKDYLGESIP